jgi:hypothetical protein
MGQDFEFQGWELYPTFSIAPRVRDERLEANIQAVRQRSIPKHFILKAIWRNSPNPVNPTLF